MSAPAEKVTRAGFRSMLAKHAAKRLERARAVRRILQGGERPIAFEVTGQTTIAVLIHLDTYPGRVGAWRVTRFGPGFEPWGHDTAESYRAALELAATDGANLTHTIAI